MSETKIKDGTGTGNLVKVNSLNELEVRSVTENVSLDAARRGLGTNLVTGIISLTADTESAVCYVKNTSTAYELVIDVLAVGVGKVNGTVTNPVFVRGYHSPTGGTIISDAVAGDVNNNRKIGSPAPFSGLFYKGGEGKTQTGGDLSVLLFQNANGRLAAPLNIIVPTNQSFAVTVTPNGTSGCDIYCALVSYYQEPTL